MHEDYVLWALKLHIWKQILKCIMLKYYCVLHHLQLNDKYHLDYGLGMICIMLSHLFFCDIINDTHILHKLRFVLVSTSLSLVW